MRIGQIGDLPVSIDTHEYAGQSGRILMRLRADGVPPGALTVRWSARHTLVGGVAQSGERAVVAEVTALGQSIDDVMTFEIRATSGAGAQIEILPEFEFEPAGALGNANRLTATGADGGPLRVVLTPAQLFAEAVPAARGDVLSPTEPLPAWVDVTGRGVRLQRNFAHTRVAFSPEVTDQYGLAFKAAVGRALSSRAAFGIVGGGGAAQQDVVVNVGWQVSPSQRLLVTAGSMQQQMDLAFDTGTEQRRLHQSSGGGAYSVMLGGRFQPRLDTQAYFAGSGSRDLGSVQYFKDADGQAQIFRQDRRVAGALLTGAQTRASFSLLPESTLTVSLGAERLRYAFATGDQSTTTLTRGVEWAQQIVRGYTVQGFARTQAAMHTTGVAIERTFTSHGQRLGIGLTKIDGRHGVADDLQLRLTHSFAFGSGNQPTPQMRAGAASETDPGMTALLNEVSQRPAFLPLVPLAKVDHSRRAERLVAIDHDGMVAGTRIDSADGTITVPTEATVITGITRNLRPFTNTGQFAAANGALLIHPMNMEDPITGPDQYVVSMRRADDGVTTVTIDVIHGSVHITRVTVVRQEVDTTPDTFAFAAVLPAAVNRSVASAAVAISGLAAVAPISIVGGEYSIDGGPFTSTPGTIGNGQRVVVRVKAPATHGTTATALLAIGGVSAEFTVSSEAADRTPTSFTFAARTGVDRNTLVESEEVIMAGMNEPGTISVDGGDYAINGGPYTTARGRISSGDSVRLRVRSSSAASTAATATLTIGDLTVPFLVTTAKLAAPGPDTTPDAFTFAVVTGAARNTAITSAAVTVGGIDAATALTIVGGEYSINGGPFRASPGTVSSGQSVRLRVTSSSAYSTTLSALVTIGGIPSEFAVTTVAEPAGPDTTPNGFGFTAQNGLIVSTQVVSDSVTIGGIDAPTAIASSNGEYSVNNSPFTAAPGTISNGQSVRVRLTTSANVATSTTATVTIGGVEGAFTASTVGADTTPDAFSFTAQTGVARSTRGGVQWGGHHRHQHVGAGLDRGRRVQSQWRRLHERRW